MVSPLLKESTIRNFRYLFSDRPRPRPSRDVTCLDPSSPFLLVIPLPPPPLSHQFPHHHCPYVFSPTLLLRRKGAIMDRIGLGTSAAQQSESEMREYVHDALPRELLSDFRCYRAPFPAVVLVAPVQVMLHVVILDRGLLYDSDLRLGSSPCRTSDAA